jgi:hypothetical protein
MTSNIRVKPTAATAPNPANNSMVKKLSAAMDKAIFTSVILASDLATELAPTGIGSGLVHIISILFRLGIGQVIHYSS